MDIKRKILNLYVSISELEYIDISRLNEFKREMCSARTSSFFNNERQELYRELNSNFLRQETSFSLSPRERNRNRVKTALIKDRLLNLSSIVREQYY